MLHNQTPTDSTSDVATKSDEMQHHFANFSDLASKLRHKYENTSASQLSAESALEQKQKQQEAEMKKAHQRYLDAKSGAKFDVMSQPKVNKFEKSLNDIVHLVSKNYEKPSDVNVEADREWIADVRIHTEFLRRHGRKWEPYQSRLDHAEKALKSCVKEDKRPPLIKTLNENIADAKLYCMIKNKYNLFNDKQNYAKYLKKISHYEEINADHQESKSVQEVHTETKPTLSAQNQKKSDPVKSTQKKIDDVAKTLKSKLDKNLESANHQSSNIEGLDEQAADLSLQAKKFEVKREEKKESSCCSCFSNCFTMFFKKKDKSGEKQPLLEKGKFTIN